jgi:hypothetical protein
VKIIKGNRVKVLFEEQPNISLICCYSKL